MAKRELRSMRIEPAKNGYTVHTEHAPKKATAGKAMPWSRRSRKYSPTRTMSWTTCGRRWPTTKDNRTTAKSISR